MSDRPPSFAARAAPVALAIFLTLAYCLCVIVQVPQVLPEFVRVAAGDASRSLYRLLNRALELFGQDHPSFELRSGLYLLIVAIVIPWAVMLLLGRGRPRDFGLRAPNRLGWRFVVVGGALAVPFLIWMVKSPTFAAGYLGHLRRVGLASFAAYYLVNMLCEHFLLQGVVLAVCRRGRRWPSAPGWVPHTRRGFKGMLGWIGLAQPVEGARGTRAITRWLGLPPGCVPAILTSGLIFAAVHLGKDSRELLLSLPGGIILGFVAYRANTWLVPFVLHLVTATAALAMIVWFL